MRRSRHRDWCTPYNRHLENKSDSKKPEIPGKHTAHPAQPVSVNLAARTKLGGNNAGRIRAVFWTPALRGSRVLVDVCEDTAGKFGGANPLRAVSEHAGKVADLDIVGRSVIFGPAQVARCREQVEDAAQRARAGFNTRRYKHIEKLSHCHGNLPHVVLAEEFAKAGKVAGAGTTYAAGVAAAATVAATTRSFVLDLPVVNVDVCVDGTPAESHEVVCFSVAIEVGVSYRSLRTHARRDGAHAPPLSSRSIGDLAQVAVGLCSATRILDDVVGLTVACEIGELDLAAGLADAGGHGLAFAPDALAVLGGDVLIVYPSLNSTAIVQDEEVGISVAIEISEPDFATRLSNTRRDGDALLPDALALRGIRQVAVV